MADVPAAVSSPTAEPRDNSFGAVAARLYAPREPEPAAEVAKPAEKPAEAAPEPAFDRIARGFYGDSVTTRAHVDWDEDSAGPARFDPVPNGVEIDQAEHTARMPVVREALIEAGVGPTLARELHGEVFRYAERPFTGTQQQAEAALRRQWGPDFDRKLGAAREMVAKACRKAPELKTVLERTGLGNDPAFITKLARRADALARKGTR